ncbi:MAG: Phage-related minor tail protein [Lentisphaerae bacterium ADurb.Bin242]|nr:MAG: Phage-related minor tail protein [Lentisphaerae bacterium ADurb.Bin242]
MSLSSNIRAGAAYVEVTAETSKLQRGLTQAQAQLQNFGRSCTSIGKDLLMVSGALALPFGLAVRGFAEFDDRMRLVKAVTKATGSEFESMTKVAEKLGRETSFTAKQVADGMVSLGRMGFSPKEIEASIQPVLDLARATGTELGEAADIAANSMRIFGIEASKMSSVADVLTVTANGSAQTLTDLFEALKMAGPQAKAAGENIVETSAALGVLANMGIKGSLAGTALRKSFSQFAQVKVQDQLKAVGVETLDANGNLRKMADIMADLARVMAAMPTGEKLAFAEDIFDIRGSLAGLTLTGNVKELEAFLGKLHDVDGTARKTAEEMDAGLGGSFRMLLSAVEGAAHAIAKALEGTLQPLIDKLTNVTLAVIGWIEANSGMVTSFAIAVAGAAALGAVLIAVGVAAKGMAAGIAVVHTALKAFTFVQGLCVAEGTTLGNSFSLIGQAFRNYRNLAVPALVGTEQLCAAFGLASSAANRAAASLVLMSNAEAAGVAKAKLAAVWNSACSALKSFNLATVAATAAIKAQAIAEGAAALGTKILAAARALAAGVTALFSAANLKAAATATAGGAANLFLAFTTKAVAAGYLAASAAAAAFCAIPISWILIGVGAALAGVVLWLSQASKYTAQLSDKMETLRQRGDEQRQTDRMRMERLKQLSEKQKLSSVEMAEAESLVKTLSGRYGDFGAALDKVAGKLNLAADAQDHFNEGMKKAALAQIDAEISEYEANLKELSAENESLLSYWNHNLWSQVSGRQEESLRKLEANGDRMSAMRKKMDAAKLRKKAILSGDPDAVSGETGPNTAENVETENRRRQQSSDEADAAAKKVAEIDRKLARERRTELQNEIEDILALRDEYKALIQTMLDYEKSKPEAKQDKGKIAELEKKKADADRTADERVAGAKEKAAGKMRKDVEDFQRRFEETERDVQERRNEDARDRQINDTLKSDKNAGISMLQGMIGQYRQAAELAKAQFQRELEMAQADGTIDEEERRRIGKAQSDYSSAESFVDKYESKLREVQEGTRKAADNLKPQGTFLAAALDSLGGVSAEERTAKATEAIVANTKKTNDLLKRGGKFVFA